ncbi:toxin [Rufibacter latericius]|uniref:Toxin n=1 Tax=Rufibacter latericius TaxID=2487040 RepID=A0A3M9MEP7_9BACT|nr:toxin [Rufibacter latericius]RNI24031.1 toxin [Rufibacter latericius]
MASREEVRRFLNDFHAKLGVFNILFRDDRGKNSKTLLALEITPASRRKIIEELEVIDYSEGPLEDTLYDVAPMWVFGKNVKREEVYIKISMGRPSSNVICISFHLAEKPMVYPFKSK